MGTDSGITTGPGVLSRGEILKGDLGVETCVGRGVNFVGRNMFANRKRSCEPIGDDGCAIGQDDGIARVADNARGAAAPRKVDAGDPERERGPLEHGASTGSVVSMRAAGSGPNSFRDGQIEGGKRAGGKRTFNDQRIFCVAGGGTFAAIGDELSGGISPAGSERDFAVSYALEGGALRGADRARWSVAAG